MNPDSLHARIMALPVEAPDAPWLSDAELASYRRGRRDGRDSAAKLVAAAAPQGAQPAEPVAERLAALAGPLEQPQEPQSGQENLAQASGVCDLQTALPEQPEDYWIRQHTAARLAEMEMRRQVDRIERELEEFCLWLNESGLQHVAHELASRVVILPLPPGESLPLQDIELPGMWESADFMGGQDEVRGAACEAVSGEVPSNKPAASSAPESSVSVPKEQQ